MHQMPLFVGKRDLSGREIGICHSRSRNQDDHYDNNEGDKEFWNILLSRRMLDSVVYTNGLNDSDLKSLLRRWKKRSAFTKKERN